VTVIHALLSRTGKLHGTVKSGDVKIRHLLRPWRRNLDP